MAAPKTATRTDQQPSPTPFGHQPRIGEEVRFAYSNGGEVVLTKAKVVFLWPGDVVDLDVRIPGEGKVRRERVRPHVGSEPQPDTWRP